jgi:hypothetical protein
MDGCRTVLGYVSIAPKFRPAIRSTKRATAADGATSARTR